VSLKFVQEQQQILRLTTRKLKSVWGPFRSATVCICQGRWRGSACEVRVFSGMAIFPPDVAGVWGAG